MEYRREREKKIVCYIKKFNFIQISRGHSHVFIRISENVGLCLAS